MSYINKNDGNIITLDQYIDLPEENQLDYEFYEPPVKEWGRDPDPSDERYD